MIYFLDILSTRRIAKQVRVFTCIIALALMAVAANAQTLTTSCSNSVVAGAYCSYTLKATSLTGLGIKYGYPLTTYYNSSEGKWVRVYTYTWNSTGNFTQCITEGGQCMWASSTVSVYPAVGPLTVTQTGGWGSCEYTSTFSASASGASWYTWSLSPSSAGSVSGTTVYWNTGYSGSASLTVKAFNNGTTTAGAPTQVLNFTRVARITFDGTLSVPSSNVCEGTVATYTASANAPATYEWYIGVDNNTVVATTPSISSSLPSPDDPVVRVRITAIGSTCLDGSLSKLLSSAVIHPNFQIIERVHGLSIASPIPNDTRCQAAGSDEFTASASSASSYSWSFSPPEAGTLSGSGSTRTVTWDPTFNGNANVTVTAFGCGGSQVSSTKTITVNKLPTIFDLSGPTDLCGTHAATLQLSGSEPGVNYELFRKATPDHPWFPNGADTTSSWQLPIGPGIISTGEYYVSATAPGCVPQNTTIHTINRIMPPPIVATSDTPNFVGCEGSLVKVTASGGSDYKWYLDLSNAPSCTQVLNPDDRVCRLEVPGCPNNECYWQMYSGMPTAVYYASAEDDPVCHEGGSSQGFSFSVVDRLSLKKLESSEEFVCAGAAPTIFKLNSTGPAYNTSWNVVTSAAVSSTLELSSDQFQVTWDPTFTGVAEVKFEGEGCQGMESISQYVTIYPTLEPDENSVRSFQAQQPFTRSLDLVTNMLQPDKVALSTSYFDGLGRNIQNVSTKASPQQKDVVEAKRYDDFGRESIKYLPYVDNSSLDYRSTAFNDQHTFYANAGPTLAQDTDPYSVTQFEASPLNRPLKQGAPGTDWQPGSSDLYDLNDHTVKMAYEISGLNEVIWFSYDPTSGSISADGNGQIRYYPEGELFANKTFDEANNATVEFTDKEGRTLCKKVQYGGDMINPLYASTYYIYDNLGNLVTVLPPEAVNSAINQLTGN